MKKRLIVSVLCICMIVTMLPAVSLTAKAEGSQFDNIFNLHETVPTGFDHNSTENPFGYAVGQPFLLSESNELMMYITSDINEGGNKINTAIAFDRYKPQNVLDLNPADQKFTAFKGSGYYNTTLGGNTYSFSYVKAVAFDPTGSGRDDHVAYIGAQPNSEDENKMDLWLWVQDTTSSQLFTGSWAMVGTFSFPKNIDNDIALNYFDITAGHYESTRTGDTIIVYTPEDNGNYGLIEYSYKNRMLSRGSGSRNGLNPSYASSSESGLDFSNLDNIGCKLGVSMDTGDFNGDGIEDVAIVSYFNVKNHANDFRADCNFYEPYLTIYYGNYTGGLMGRGNYQGSYLYSRGDTDSSGVFTDTSAVSPGLACGDVDGDGKDEIIVSGIKNTISSIANTSDALREKSYNLNREKLATFICGGDNAGSAPVCVYQEIDANKWTLEGFRNDRNFWQQIGVECVEINGPSNPAFVFISGTLYEYQKTKLNGVMTPTYFTEKRDDDTYVQAMTAGNFDDNDAGREQVVFIIGEKKGDTNNSEFRIGLIGGKNYNDGATYGLAQEYYGTDIGHEDSVLLHIARGDTWKSCLSLVVVAVDKDDDGLMARYKEKSYVYADPKVIAVLQMAPYFGEIDIGSDAGQTTYSFTQEYEYTTGTSNSTSYGIGMSTSIEGGGVNLSMSAGYQNSWSESFENTLTTSTTESFTAKAYDSVVVYRTPIFIYEYEVYNESTHSWNPDDTMAISVPKTPVYIQMSVDDYNKFVDEYNAMAEEASTDGKYTSMKKLEKNYLGQEGNPWGYSNNLQQVSENSYQLGYNGGETSSASASGSSTSHEITQENGFSFEMSLEFGYTGAFFTSTAGVNTSLEYMSGKSTTTTESTSKETSGTVQDLDAGYLLDEYGIPYNVTQSYGFTWNLAKDTADLGVAGTSALVIAYNVNDIKAPPVTVTDLIAQQAGETVIDLSWTKPMSPGWRDSVDGYNVYIKESDGDYVKQNDEPLGDDVTEYRVEGLKSNTNYVFVVTAVHKAGENKWTESVWSNEVVTMTPKANVPLYFDFDTDEVTLNASHLGNVEIESGDAIPEETIIYVETAAKEGYAITGVTIDRGNGNVETVTMVDGKFNFVIREGTTIKVTSEPIVDETFVSYTDEYTVKETVEGEEVDVVIGTVTVKADGNIVDPSGGKVTGNVELIAEPAEGYVLKSWTIKSKTGGVALADNVIEATSNTMTLIPYADEHVITAEFVADDNPEILRTVNVNAGSNGAIIVKNGDQVLEPDADGNIKVVRGTELTFEAKADAYCALNTWTGDFADYKDKETVITLAVFEDLDVGANFRVSVEYMLTFGAQSENGGTGTLTAVANGNSINSGDYLRPETKVEFNAEAGADSRIVKWAISEGTVTTFLPMEGLVTEDSYTLESLTAKSNVDAYFRKIEEYTLTIETPVNGSITVTRGDDVLSDGDTIKFGDVVKVTAKPTGGYKLHRLIVNGSSVDVDTEITVVDNLQISAEFVENDSGGTVIPPQPTYYAINVADGIKGGTVTVNPTSAQAGAEVTVTVTPDDGYELDTLTVTGKNGKEVTLTKESDTTWTFKQIAEDVTVNATFKENGPWKNPFTDVTEADWYYNAVKYVYENGLMIGTEDDIFSPEEPTTRGMLVTILYRLEGCPEVTGTSGFTDVPEDSYYADAITWAAPLDIIYGHGDGTFTPDEPLTREQMAAILYRYAQYKKYDTTARVDMEQFTDVDTLSEYAYDAFSWAVAEGLLIGNGDGTISPAANAARGELAIILLRFSELA